MNERIFIEINGVKQGMFSLKCLTDSMLYTDLIEQVSYLKAPVYIFHGKHDHIASYAMAKDFIRFKSAVIKRSQI